MCGASGNEFLAPSFRTEIGHNFVLAGTRAWKSVCSFMMCLFLKCFSSAVCRTPPTEIFLIEVGSGSLLYYVGELSDPVHVFESQNYQIVEEYVHITRIL